MLSLLDLQYGYEGLGNPGKMIVIVLYLIVGLVFIIKGGDFFVDAASWIAEKFGIPKLIVGATIVSFATTLPELLVSVFAAIEGAQSGLAGDVDMATGNAIGSVIANTGLIMSISILFMPVAVERKAFIVKPCMLLLSVLLLFLFSLDNNLVVYESIILLLILVLFFVDNVLEAKRQMKVNKSLASVNGTASNVNMTQEMAASQSAKDGDNKVVEEANQKVEDDKKKAKKTTIINIVKFIVGVAGIVIGAQLLVDNGKAFATELGVPDKIIAITIVAIGTSLPELITTITAIAKKQSELSVGNVIGANIIDITLILSLCSIIYGKGLPVFNSTLYLDLPFCFVIVAFATVPTMFTKKLQRWQGIVCLALYITYLVLSCTLTF